jgi:hypothetical protein
VKVYCTSITQRARRGRCEWHPAPVQSCASDAVINARGKLEGWPSWSQSSSVASILRCPLAHLRKANFEQNGSAFGATSSVATACSTTTDEPVGIVSYLHKGMVDATKGYQGGTVGFRCRSGLNHCSNQMGQWLSDHTLLGPIIMDVGLAAGSSVRDSKRSS